MHYLNNPTLFAIRDSFPSLLSTFLYVLMSMFNQTQNPIVASNLLLAQISSCFYMKIVILQFLELLPSKTNNVFIANI